MQKILQSRTFSFYSAARGRARRKRANSKEGRPSYGPAAIRRLCLDRRGDSLAVAGVATERLVARTRQSAGKRRSFDRHPRQERYRRRSKRNRLRRRAQQLLPARHARADGAQRRRLGKRPRGVSLPLGRLHADQPGGHARKCRTNLRRAKSHRIRINLRRRKRRLPTLHERHRRRLADGRHNIGAARKTRRLCSQQSFARRLGEKSASRRSANHSSLQGHRIPTRQRLASRPCRDH